MIGLETTAVPGVLIINLPQQFDHRGAFVKTIQEPVFNRYGMRTDFMEQFLTTSKRNVLRGMHCQLPPHDHAKFVSCVYGRILDVVVDLRVNGPSFGACISAVLDASSARGIYIPPGCAHGFVTLSDEAITLYNVTSLYAPGSDSGVHWRTINFSWPVIDPIISERDQNLISLQEFQSPFTKWTVDCE